MNFEKSNELWEKYQEMLKRHNNDVDEAFNAEFSESLKLHPKLKEAHPELKKFLLFTWLCPIVGEQWSSTLDSMYREEEYNSSIVLKLNILARGGDLNKLNEIIGNTIYLKHSLGYFDILRESSYWMELNEAPKMFVPANDEATKVKLVDFNIDYLNPANKSNLPPEVAKLVDLTQNPTKFGSFLKNVQEKHLGLSIPEEPQPSEN